MSNRQSFASESRVGRLRLRLVGGWLPDFVNLIELFKTKDCRFLSILGKCVFLESFRVAKNWLHANFR